MNLNIAVRNAQVYRILADALLYPRYNWLDNLTDLNRIFEECDLSKIDNYYHQWDLDSLQSEYSRVFGLTGSLCYETEYGLPHEFRQAQELSDLNGFYQAFGFKAGGKVRERPDHIAVELEFMYLLALKEADAIVNGTQTQVEISVDAQKNFLQAHLGSWIGLFSQAVNLNNGSLAHPDEVNGQIALTFEDGLYSNLVASATAFVNHHARKLGVSLETVKLSEIQATPLGPELSCGECPIA